MPTFRKLTEEERDAALDAFDSQLLSIMEGQRKLRERLETVRLESEEAAEIRISMIRLDLKADEIMRNKEDFEDDTLALDPPSPTMLTRMAERVAAIREINVRNETARGILKAIVVVAGQLPKASGLR